MVDTKNRPTPGPGQLSCQETLSLLVAFAMEHSQGDLPSVSLPHTQCDLLRTALLVNNVIRSPKRPFNTLRPLTSGERANLGSALRPWRGCSQASDYGAGAAGAMSGSSPVLIQARH